MRIKAVYFKSRHGASHKFPEDPESWGYIPQHSYFNINVPCWKNNAERQRRLKEIFLTMYCGLLAPIFTFRFGKFTFLNFLIFEVNATHLPTESKITHKKMEVITSHGCNSTGSQKASFKVEVLAHSL